MEAAPKQRVAILTGGASGIGRSLSEELARRGVEVVVADRQGDLAAEVVEKIRGSGGRAQGVEVDVRSAESMQGLVDSTLARTGRLDYFFNNAGIGVGGPIEAYSAADWQDVLDVNLRGVIHGIQAAYPAMVRQKFGHLVNTASLAGLVAGGGGGSYTATKFAVVGLSKALRIEAAYHNVRVSVLCPGVVRTAILQGGKYGRLNMQGVSQEFIDRFWEKLRPMDPHVFAHRALDAIAKNRALIVLPRFWLLAWYFDRFFPDLSLWLATRSFRKMRLELEAGGAAPAAADKELRA